MSGSLLLKLIIDGSNAGAIKALSGVSEAAKRADGITSGALENIADKLNQVRTGALAVGAAIVGVNGIGDLVRLADGYTAVNARLKLASESSADFTSAQRGIFEISQRNGRELDATATLYSRIVQPMRDLGKTGKDALTITDAVSASLRISGATAAESASAQIQFSQALAAGTLQGEELNSVLESSPALARALATAMHVSVGALKAMGAEGKLTSKIIAEALLSQADGLISRAKQMESTIGEALTRVRNAFQKAVGDKATEGVNQIASGINTIANNMQTLTDAAALAGAAMASVLGVRIIASIGAAVVAKQALIAAERESAAMALATAQANVRAAQSEAARTLTTKSLVVAQGQLALAESASAIAAGGVAARASGALLAMLGGPIGAIATALTVGITAWQLWGNRSEEATGKASVSLAKLIKEMQEFGANASVAEKTKQYQALSEAIEKARQEEQQLREAAKKQALSDPNIATKAQLAGAIENDPKVAAKVAERLAAERALQDELTTINKNATGERQFLVKSLVEKMQALNGELVVDEKKALATRQADNVAAAQAVLSAWTTTLNEIKAKRAEAEAAPGKAADLAASLKTRTDNVRSSGMSEEDKAAFQAQQMQDAQAGAVANQTRGRFELIKGYSQQLRGEFDAAKKSFDTAEKDLNRAFNEAEKAGNSGMMDELSDQLADIERQRGKMADQELQQLEQQAEAQRSKLAELEGNAESLKNKLAGMEVQVKIDGAMANLIALEEKAMSVAATLARIQGTPQTPNSPIDSAPKPAVPGRAFGGPLPGYAPHDRADNVLYRGTPGEWVIQRPAVRYWGPDFLAAINGMRFPKFAYGGEIGGSAINRLAMPQLSNAPPSSNLKESARTPLILDFGKLGRHEVSASVDVAAEINRVFKRTALQFGRR